MRVRVNEGEGEGEGEGGWVDGWIAWCEDKDILTPSLSPSPSSPQSLRGFS
jgi:hypothetical protein